MDEALQTVKKAYLGLCLYYGITIPDEAIVMYAEDLRGYPVEQVLRTMNRLRQRRTRMPLPGDIIDALGGHQDEEARASDIAGLIWQAMAQDGYTNPDRARRRIGEVGWHVVERMGGWQALCNSQKTEGRGTLFAQCRALARARLEAPPAEQPALPAASSLVA